uniref:Uncharacterized protein n=1 Tax=Tetraselmis sp. GSL018 TaxID=582737 RepID=A0A061S7C0_9CHLO|mmetsp:Transcript_20366/g.48514  ORF Transcript_20366/g.48514 Transcript_20366/m.48514 type:complete len:125 (-) Transcript_20366:96-470(-)
MVGAEDTTSGLGNSSGTTKLFTHLEGILKQLEEASGEKDNEARNLLDTLRTQLDGVDGSETSEPSLSETSEGQLETQIDSLEQQLSDVETKVKALPEEAREMLGLSTSLWMAGGSSAGSEAPAK